MVEILRLRDPLSARSAPLSRATLEPASPAAAPFDPLARLLAEIAIGHDRAFARLYELAGARLFAVARRIVRHDDLAEDVLQEAFLRIWRAAYRYDPAKGSAYAWLICIVRNRALSARSRAGRHEDSQAALDIETMASDAPDPAALVVRSDEARRVKACLANLPANHRRSVSLVYFEGLTHGELADRLGVQLGTAKSWVRRGLAQMSKCLLRDDRADRYDLVAADYAIGSLQGKARRGFERRRERDARFCVAADRWEAELALLTDCLPEPSFRSSKVWKRIQDDVRRTRAQDTYRSMPRIVSRISEAMRSIDPRRWFGRV